MAKETFGEYLKRERHLRQISLEEISDCTKIDIRMLKAMEADQWNELPAEVFIRGFIKSYAEFIGLVPEDALLRYDEEKAADREKDTLEETTSTSTDSGDQPREEPRSWFKWIIGAIVSILVGLAYWLFRRP